MTQQQAPVRPKFTIGSIKRKERYLNALIYGASGVGKTYLAGSSSKVPQMQDVLYVDIERGDLTLQGVFEDHIDRVTLESYSQLTHIANFLQLHAKFRDDGDEAKLLEHLRQFFEDDVAEPRHYRTVVIDSLSEAQKYCWYHILGIKPSDQRDLEAIPEYMEQSQWGSQLEMIRLLVRRLRNLPYHVIFIAGEKVKEDAKKRQIKLISLTGQVQGEIQQFFDVVGYLASAVQTDEQGKTKVARRLYLTPGSTWIGKSRIAGLEAPYLNNPTMLDLVKPLL